MITSRDSRVMAVFRRVGVALALLAIAVAVGAAACAGEGRGSPASDTRAGDLPWIVATTDIVGHVVAQVGGDAIDLSVLLPPGQDPHGYEPTARILGELSEARVIFMNGFGLEENLLEVLLEVAEGRLVSVSDGIVPGEISLGIGPAGDQGDTLETDGGHGRDPHTWMSPVNVKTWVRNIQSALTAIDSESAAVYDKNATAYLLQLDELDRFVRDALSTVPPARRKLVTDHRVFGYFADEYGFEQAGFVLESSSTNAEATPKELVNLVLLIREERIPAIFVGGTANPRLAQLAESIAVEAGHDVQVLPVLTGSLAGAGEPGDTYLSFIRFNVAQIVTGLGDR